MAAILGVKLGSLGALLLGFGALLLLIEAAGPDRLRGTTWGGTLGTPERRLGSGFQVAGAALVTLGSALLLIDASDLSLDAVVVTVGSAAVLTYLVMAIRLRTHLRALARIQTESSDRSLLWCLAHPLWRPPLS